jgi:signal transduction histidine kinase
MAEFQSIHSPERGVLLLDTHGRVTFANIRAAEALGVFVGDLLGSPLPDAIRRHPVTDDEVIDEVIDGLLPGGGVFHRYSTPLYTAEGQVASRVEILSDITARRELEKEISERNIELADLNQQLKDAQEQLIASERLRALGEMAAGVAHDINNVLGIILGNAQLAKRKLDADHPALESIQALELAARDGAETVRRLREIGKPIDPGSYTQIDLNAIVDDVVKAAIPAWREQTEASEVSIKVDTDLSADCIVLGNAVELREALANILLNAVQSMDSGGSIRIRTRRDNFGVELQVTDSGSGMTAETQSRVFDPFFTTRGAEGTGLGMSVVDAIAIRHRGRVTIDSEEGRGTSVTLRLPDVSCTCSD